MKNIILLFSTFYMIQTSSFAQEKKSKKWWPTLDCVELLGTYELFGNGYGFVAKGKSQILDTNHFELYHGIAYQQSHQFIKDKLLTGIKGYNSDVGVYFVFDMMLYPFKTKNIFTSLEPYAGLTILKSKGTLDIPKYHIHESYSNRYTYLNYGITQTFGYNFGKISTSLFAMVSLKGYLDNGRTRPGDSDSKIFLGINFSYRIKTMN